MQGCRILRVKETKEETAGMITMYSLNGRNDKSRSLIQKHNAQDRELKQSQTKYSTELKTRLTHGRPSVLDTNPECNHLCHLLVPNSIKSLFK